MMRRYFGGMNFFNPQGWQRSMHSEASKKKAPSGPGRSADFDI